MSHCGAGELPPDVATDGYQVIIRRRCACGKTLETVRVGKDWTPTLDRAREVCDVCDKPMREGATHSECRKLAEARKRCRDFVAVWNDLEIAPAELMAQYGRSWAQLRGYASLLRSKGYVLTHERTKTVSQPARKPSEAVKQAYETAMTSFHQRGKTRDVSSAAPARRPGMRSWA